MFSKLFLSCTILFVAKVVTPFSLKPTCCVVDKIPSVVCFNRKTCKLNSFSRLAWLWISGWHSVTMVEIDIVTYVSMYPCIKFLYSIEVYEYIVFMYVFVSGFVSGLSGKNCNICDWGDRVKNKARTDGTHDDSSWMKLFVVCACVLFFFSFSKCKAKYVVFVILNSDHHSCLIVWQVDENFVHKSFLTMPTIYNAHYVYLFWFFKIFVLKLFPPPPPPISGRGYIFNWRIIKYNSFLC